MVLLTVILTKLRPPPGSHGNSDSDEAPPTSRITSQSFTVSRPVLVWKVCEQVLVSPQTGAESPRQQDRAAAASLPVSPFSLNGK